MNIIGTDGSDEKIAAIQARITERVAALKKAGLFLFFVFVFVFCLHFILFCVLVLIKLLYDIIII